MPALQSEMKQDVEINATDTTGGRDEARKQSFWVGIGFWVRELITWHRLLEWTSHRQWDLDTRLGLSWTCWQSQVRIFGLVEFFSLVTAGDLSHEQYTRGINHNFVPAPRFLENGSFHTSLGSCAGLCPRHQIPLYVPALTYQQRKWDTCEKPNRGLRN